MTLEERLALVIVAHVAMIRADQAKERAALLDRQTHPAMDALERYAKLHGREPDMDAPGDAAAFGGLIAAAGGASISPEMVEAVSAAAEESAQAGLAAANAHRAVSAAMRASGAAEHITTQEWLGVDTETLDRALDAALEEEGEVTR